MSERLARMLENPRSRVERTEDGTLLVMLNDFFVPAADAEEIPPEEINAVLAAWERRGWWGILDWVIQRRYVRVAAGAGDPQVHLADCNVTMGRRSADHRIHCDCSVAAGDRPPAPSEAGLNLSAVNLARCTSPDGFNHPLASWSIAEWTNAVAGEAGEACNLAKKLIRFRDGVAGNNKPEDKNQDDLQRRIAEELADVIIYSDLGIAAVGYDMATVVRDVFNRKSQEIGSPYVLGAVRPTPRAAPGLTDDAIEARKLAAEAVDTIAVPPGAEPGWRRAGTLALLMADVIERLLADQSGSP